MVDFPIETEARRRLRERAERAQAAIDFPELPSGPIPKAPPPSFGFSPDNPLVQAAEASTPGDRFPLPRPNPTPTDRPEDVIRGTTPTPTGDFLEDPGSPTQLQSDAPKPLESLFPNSPVWLGPLGPPLPPEMINPTEEQIIQNRLSALETARDLGIAIDEEEVKRLVYVRDRIREGTRDPGMDIINALDFGSAVIGGSLIDSFNELKGGRTVLSEGFGGFAEDPRDIAARQQDRSLAVRAVSELFIPGLEGAGLAGGLARIPFATARVAEAAGQAAVRGGARFAGAAISEQLSQLPRYRDFLKDLTEFGLVLDSTANSFAAPLRGFDEVVQGIVVKGEGSGFTKYFGSSGPLGEIAAHGINPSVGRNTAVGKKITAYQQQRVAGDELVSVGMGSAYDFHLGQFAKDPIVDAAEKLKVPYQTLMGNPDAYNLPAATRRMIDDVNQMTNDEATRLLEDAGITQNRRSRPANQYYVPRNVIEIRGIELERHSNPNLRLHYEDITEGLDAGVVYGKNPRQDTELYMRWVYRTVAKKQFDDAMEWEGLSPRSLVPEEIRTDYSNAIVNKRRQEIIRRRIRRGIKTAESNLRVIAERAAGREGSLALTVADIEKLDDVIERLDLLPFEQVPILPIATGQSKQRIKDLGRVAQAREALQTLNARAAAQKGKTLTTAEVKRQIKARRDLLEAYLENAEEQLIRADAEFDRTKSLYSAEIDELKATIQTEAPGSLFGAGQPDSISVQQWHNKFFKAEDAKLLEQQLGPQAAPGVLTKGLTTVANTRRFLAAVGDFAMPMIQGLPVLATNPEAWAKMSLRHYQAFFFPDVQAKLIRDNLADFQWLASHGVPIGDPEFFAALQIGQGVSFNALFKRLPKGAELQGFMRAGGRQTFGRFQASYNTGLGMARVLLLKGARESWKGTDAELAQYIRNLTGGLDSRAIGIGPTQRAAEGVWLAFSPRLLRSTLALTKDAMNPTTVVGRRSLRTLATLAAGANMAFIMTGLALGKDWEEIEVGLNPLNGKRYLSYQINGDWIGVGGQVRALTQVLSTAVADPSQLITNDRYNNPLIKFWTGRGAPGQEIAGSIIEAATRGKINALPFEEIDGWVDLVKFTGTAHLPFAVQGVIEGEEIRTTAFGLQGFRTSPETPFDKQRTSREEAMKTLNIEGEYKTQDLDVKANINDLVPQEVKDEVTKLQRQRQNKVQIYKDAIADIDEIFDARIETLAAEGPGQVFRDGISFINNGRAERKTQERSVSRHEEALEIFEELEPSEALFDIVRDEYFAITHDPQLDNLFGEYNFDLLESGLTGLRSKRGEEMVDRVQEFVYRNDHPLVKELRRDRERLRAYWNVTREVKAFNLSEFPAIAEEVNASWDTYLAIREPLKKKYYRDSNSEIATMEKRVRSRREGMLERDPELDILRIKWDYQTTFNTEEGFDFIQKKLEGFR